MLGAAATGAVAERKLEDSDLRDVVAAAKECIANWFILVGSCDEDEDDDCRQAIAYMVSSKSHTTFISLTANAIE